MAQLCLTELLSLQMCPRLWRFQSIDWMTVNRK